jgi:hypothetical protein
MFAGFCFISADFPEKSLITTNLRESLIYKSDYTAIM